MMGVKREALVGAGSPQTQLSFSLLTNYASYIFFSTMSF